MPQPIHSDSSALEQDWAKLVCRASSRLRSGRSRAGFLAGALFAVPASALAATTAAINLPRSVSLGLLATAVACPLLGWFIGRLRPLSPSLVHARIDRQFGLADEALAARELAHRTSPAWRAAILRQAVAHTGSADWNTAWPLHWPRRTGLATGSAVLAALLAFFLLPQSIPAGPDSAAALRAAQQTALAELTKDWDKTAKDQKGKEWDAFRETIAELKSKLGEPNLSDRELLVALARVEARLAEASQTLASAGVSNHAEDLSDALSGIDGMEAATKALKERDLAAAAAALDKAASALAAESAKLAFKDGTPAETAKRLDKLADKAAKKGDAKLAESVKKMREAASARDAKSLAKCSASLADQSREAASCDAARSALSSVARSLSEARLALAEGRKPGDKEGGLEMAGQSQSPARGPGQGPPGNGIGNGPGDHSPGAENALADATRKESLSGTANADGESTKRTVSSSESAPTLASAATEADLAEFTRLSREAVEDESLPLEHRRAIQRYFQLIRPTQDSAPPVSKTP
ncbi:MAG: hypothetical protein WC969_15075 [Elusimicrobiota bacterium]|jgi:hypothetical protein